MESEVRHHREVARLAARQHGVVSHRQLLTLGLSSAAIARDVGAGRLHPVHRGVMAVGHPAITRHGHCLAAVLARGSAALLSHESAAWLWGLAPGFDSKPHITRPSRGHGRGGLGIHHSTILSPEDIATVDRIPVTAVGRTLLDLGATWSRRRLESTLDRAERRDLLQVGEIEELLRRSGRHRGRRNLRRALDLYLDPGFFRARSERLLGAIIRRAKLPIPAFNIFVAGHEIDAYWEAEQFAVEVDGWDTHRTRTAFEQDPIRQEDLLLAGIASIRVTARRIERSPDEVGSRLAQLLAQRRPTR